MHHAEERSYRLYDAGLSPGSPLMATVQNGTMTPPAVVNIQGESMENYSKNVACMRLSEGRTTRLANLEQAVRHVGMIYDVDTSKITVAGSEIYGNGEPGVTKAVFQLSPRCSGAKWMDRVRRLASDPVVMRSSPATDIYVVHCWLINPGKFNLLSWLLVYLSDK